MGVKLLKIWNLIKYLTMDCQNGWSIMKFVINLNIQNRVVEFFLEKLIILHGHYCASRYEDKFSNTMWHQKLSSLGVDIPL